MCTIVAVFPIQNNALYVISIWNAGGLLCTVHVQKIPRGQPRQYLSSTIKHHYHRKALRSWSTMSPLLLPEVHGDGEC